MTGFAEGPFERPRPHGALRIILRMEQGVLLTFFAALPMLAVVFVVVLAGRASASAATQSAPTQTATVVSSQVIDEGCDQPCFKTTIRLINLARPAGDGTTLVIRGTVTGSGTRPGATIAVRQDPSNPRHIEVPGYPDSPRLRQWTWSVLAVIIGLLGAGFDFLLFRRFAWTGHFGRRTRRFAGHYLYRNPRPPGQVTTARLARHYLLPALGIPVIVALCILLAALGAGATSVNDITQLNAVGASPNGS